MKIVRVLAFGFLFSSIQLLLAGDDNTAFGDFQKLAVRSDFKTAFEESKHAHPSPLTKLEAESFEKERIKAAMNMLDAETAFEAQYPQSTHLGQVRSLTMENLWTVFGAVGLPIPGARLTDVESWAKKRLAEDPQDYRPYMILVALAKVLPPTAQEAALLEFSQEKTPEPARSMAKDALESVKRLGHPLNLKFTALDGRNVDLATLKGKVVLIDFWSTTCVPCVRELPDLKNLYNKYKSQGLEVIGITFDENKDVLQRFVQEKELPWPQYYDPKGSQNPLAQEFAIRSIPVVWLIDRHGILRDLNGREEQEQKIEKLLVQP